MSAAKLILLPVNPNVLLGHLTMNERHYSSPSVQARGLGLMLGFSHLSPPANQTAYHWVSLRLVWTLHIYFLCYLQMIALSL